MNQEWYANREFYKAALNHPPREVKILNNGSIHNLESTTA